MSPEQLRTAAETAISDIERVAHQHSPADGPWPTILEIHTILAELRANA